MLIKSSTVTGGVQRKEHTVEPKPTASSAQNFFLSKGINDQENGSIPDMKKGVNMSSNHSMPQKNWHRNR